jgi:hypothetical protein
MRLHLASLAAALATSSALLTGASTSFPDLAALQGVSISTLSEQGSVFVSLDYAGDILSEGDCRSISASATYNGVDATQIAGGRWVAAIGDAPAFCAHPGFFFDSQDVESATIEIADGTKTITVDIPHLLASRTVAFAAPARPAEGRRHRDRRS